MITDKYLRLSENQAVTASAVTTNTVDLSQARDIGEGKPLYMVFTITETFATLTSLAFNVVTDDNASLSSPTVINTVSVTLASGGLAAGKQIVLPIPPLKGSKGERYLGASFTVGGSNATTGKITTDIVETFQGGQKYYASGFTV
jgi:hypothetical protein